MNLERFRGEPDNMIDSDGNIIFGNAAANKSKTGKNIMLMSYSEEETLIGDNTAPVMLLAFSTGFRASSRNQKPRSLQMIPTDPCGRR